MKQYFLAICLLLSYCLAACHQPENEAASEEKHAPSHAKDGQYLRLSKKLVETARLQQDPADIVRQLAEAPQDSLEAELNSDASKKAFFINLYNGFVQHILIKNPEKFEDRDAFFTTPQITLAGRTLSLDDIEHGIIRGSKFKWLLGLVQNPFADEFEKTFRVDKTDARIHFALNCGAKSCPYVAVYDAERIDQQLDMISAQFLQRTSTYNPEEDVVYVSPLMSWFRGDFGGLSGAKDYLRRYNIIPAEADPDLEFTDYDWTLELGNFTDLNFKVL